MLYITGGQGEMREVDWQIYYKIRNINSLLSTVSWSYRQQKQLNQRKFEEYNIKLYFGIYELYRILYTKLENEFFSCQIHNQHL